MTKICEDHIKEWNKISKGKPLIKRNFSSFEVFKKFCNMYDEGKFKGAAQSERFFACWFCDLFEKYSIRAEIFSREKENKIEINLKINGQQIQIPKKFDFLIQKDNGTKILVELKKNIDLIEKDIFKAILLKNDNMLRNKYKIVLLIREKENKSKNREGKEGSYLTILRYAKEKNWIDYFVYLCSDDGKDVYEKNILNLVNFIKRQ